MADPDPELLELMSLAGDAVEAAAEAFYRLGDVMKFLGNQLEEAESAQNSTEAKV